MRRGGRILIVLGVVLGLLTGGAALFVLQAPAAPPVPTKPVVVVVQPIGARVPIVQTAIQTRPWPADAIPAGALTDPTKAVNKLTRMPLLPGQILLEGMILDKEKEEKERKGVGSDASFIVPKGKVAVAFPISLISGVAHALQAGDSVDVMVSLDLTPAPEPGAKTAPTKYIVTQILLQDVEVLRVGPWPQPGAAGETRETANVVTFLVNRQDALVLKFVRENSLSIDLALRAAGDREIVGTEPITQEYLNIRFNLPLKR